MDHALVLESKSFRQGVSLDPIVHEPDLRTAALHIDASCREVLSTPAVRHDGVPDAACLRRPEGQRLVSQARRATRSPYTQMAGIGPAIEPR